MTDTGDDGLPRVMAGDTEKSDAANAVILLRSQPELGWDLSGYEITFLPWELQELISDSLVTSGLGLWG